MSYSHEEIEKRVKYIDGQYYIVVTEEAEEIFGDGIIKRALVRLDIDGILYRYMEKNRFWDIGDYTKWGLLPINRDDFIVKEGVGNIFESTLNKVLDQAGKMQIHAADCVDSLVVTLINDKEVFIWNSEWGEVSASLSK